MNGIVKKAVNRLKKRQTTIDKLLEDKKIHLSGENGDDTWKLEVLYQKPECSIGFVECANASYAGSFPEHIHSDSVEYLICVRGSALFVMEGGVQRILNEGDCASIPPNREHFSKPLEDGTKIAYVCVPHDKSIPEIRR